MKRLRPRWVSVLSMVGLVTAASSASVL